jgi:hypothetical protein
VLAAGLPPAKLQAYDATVPSGSAPEPVNEIEPPGLTVTFEAGLVILAVGAWFAATTSVTVVLR